MIPVCVKGGMPLLVDTLVAGLKTIATEPHPVTADAAAKKWAVAYDTYAQQGSVVGVPRTPTGAEREAFAGPLVAAFTVVPNTPDAVANALSSSVAAYWAGAVFGPNTAATVVALPALVATATTLLSVPNDADAFAAALGTALHTCTLTLGVVAPNGAVLSLI